MNLFEAFKDKIIEIIVIGSFIENRTASYYRGKILSQDKNFIVFQENSSSAKIHYININFISSISILK